MNLFTPIPARDIFSPFSYDKVSDYFRYMRVMNNLQLLMAVVGMGLDNMLHCMRCAKAAR